MHAGRGGELEKTYLQGKNALAPVWKVPGVDRMMLKLMGKDPSQSKESFKDILVRTGKHTIDWRHGEVVLLLSRYGSGVRGNPEACQVQVDAQ